MHIGFEKLHPAANPSDAMEHLPDGAEAVRSFYLDEQELGAIVLVGAFLSMIGFTLFALVFFGISLFDFG